MHYPDSGSTRDGRCVTYWPLHYSSKWVNTFFFVTVVVTPFVSVSLGYFGRGTTDKIPVYLPIFLKLNGPYVYRWHARAQITHVEKQSQMCLGCDKKVFCFPHVPVHSVLFLPTVLDLVSGHSRSRSSVVFSFGPVSVHSGCPYRNNTGATTTTTVLFSLFLLRQKRQCYCEWPKAVA